MRTPFGEWKPAIDSAPGKEFVTALGTGSDFSLLRDFFAARIDWSGGYPLVHDYLVTYGAYDDLISHLDPEKKIALIPTALSIAESVPDRHFHAALALLANLIPDNAIRPRPEGFSDSLLRLRLRAEKLSFLPNLTCAWDLLMSRQRLLKSSGDFLAAYSPKQLQIEDDSWRRYFAFPLINLGNRLFAEHTLRMDVVRRTIQHLGAKPGERKLIYATRIEDSRYWVWRIPGTPGTAHLWKIVFIRQSVDGEAEFGHWDLYQQFQERATPDAISHRLLKIEFYPSELEPLQP